MNKNILFYIAACGWIIGLTAHLLSVADIDVTSRVPFIWVLHVGIFVVWLPVVLKLKDDKELKEYKNTSFVNRLNPFSFYKIIFKNAPSWMSVLAIICFYYAIVNFILFILDADALGGANIRDGKYVLENRGKFIRNITEEEYHHAKAAMLRGFSGHWLVFYGFAATILYPFNKTEDKSIATAGV